MSPTLVVLHDNEKKPAREIQVEVTGQQFAWSYEYPSSVTGGKPLVSDQLYVPKASRSFQHEVKERHPRLLDPRFPHQEDVVPGITTHWRATPSGSELPGRLQPALRSGPFADALDRPCRQRKNDSTPGSPARAAHGRIGARLDIDRRDFG